MTKTCKTCLAKKPLLDFYIDKRTQTPFTNCKPCYLQICTARRPHHKMDKHRKHERWVRDQYGMEAGHYDRLLQDQNNCCAICGGGPGIRRWFSVDHCHSTKAIRSLLCQSCNTAIGLMQDNPARLRLAADYLVTHRG